MINMDKKIEELNKKLGRKTGVDFKWTAEKVASEIYKDKAVLSGMVVSNGLFFLTSTGFIVSTVLGVGTYFAYKNKEKIVEKIKGRM